MSDDDREKELPDLTEHGEENYTNDLTDDGKEKEFKDLTDESKENHTKNLTDDDKLLKILNDDDNEKDVTNDNQENSGNMPDDDSGSRPDYDSGRRPDNDSGRRPDNDEEKVPEGAKEGIDREKYQKEKTEEEREKDLKVLFDLSSELSAGRGGSVPLDAVQSWFKLAGITNTDHVSEVDIGSAYRKSVEDETGITFTEFKEMIEALAGDKKVDPDEILEKLSSARTPQPIEVINSERKIGKHGNDAFL